MRPIEPASDDRPPVLICDLDGTILSVNSFPRWILHLIFGRLAGPGIRSRISLSLRAQHLLLRRELRWIDHQQLMREIQQAWHKACSVNGDESLSGFRASLRRRVRPTLRPLLRRIDSGQIDAILATAAAGEYARGLGCDLGFRHVLTTPVRLAPGQPLNGGDHKLASVLGLLARQGWMGRPLVLLTDHIDDLPLIRHCATVAWFGPSAEMPRAKAHTNGVKFIDCQRLDESAFPLALEELIGHARSLAAIGTPSHANTSS
jgi:phosphoserine phosphatase